MAADISVHAFAFASTLSMKDMPAILGGAPLERTKQTQAVIKRSDQEWIVAYDFGAIAFLGVAPDEEKRIVDAIIAKIGPEPHAPIEEHFTITVGAEQKPEVRFDRVTATDLSQQLVEVVALVVAQSCAMDYYEEDVDQILEKLRRVSEGLATTGKFRGSITELMKFIGSGMSTRNQVVYTLSLLDTPQLIWENESLDRIYRDIRAMFEIEDRYRALDHKLGMIQDNFELLVDMTRGRRSTQLEIAVLALIALEVVLFVWEIFRR